MKKIVYVLFAVLGFASGNAAAKAVASNQCSKLKNNKVPFMLILKKGENIHESITKCVNDAAINNANISGLGVIVEPTLGYYDLANKNT